MINYLEAILIIYQIEFLYTWLCNYFILYIIVITYFCFSISNNIITIEDVDIISSNPTNTAIPLIAPVLISLLVHVLVQSLHSYANIIYSVLYYKDKRK